jgi:hypothetical protein
MMQTFNPDSIHKICGQFIAQVLTLSVHRGLLRVAQKLGIGLLALSGSLMSGLVSAQTTWTPFAIDWYCSPQASGKTLCSLVAFGEIPAGRTLPLTASGWYRTLKGSAVGSGLPLATVPIALPCIKIEPIYIQCSANNTLELGAGVRYAISGSSNTTSLNIYIDTPSVLFDWDGDGQITATREGLMLARVLLGFKGAAVTQGIPFTNGKVATDAEQAVIVGIYNGWFSFLNPSDVPKPLREGLIFQRCILGVTGAALVSGIPNADAISVQTQCNKLRAIE